MAMQDVIKGSVKQAEVVTPAKVQYYRMPYDNIYNSRGELISSDKGIFTPKTSEEEDILEDIYNKGMLVRVS